MYQFLKCFLALSLLLTLAHCGDSDPTDPFGTGTIGGSSESNPPDPIPIPDPVGEEAEFTVAQISLTICIDGSDIVSVQDGKMQLRHLLYELPGTHGDCRLLTDVRVTVDDHYNPYDVWVLAPWQGGTSSEYELPLEGLRTDRPNRLANLKLVSAIRSGFPWDEPGRAYINDDNEIVFDDNAQEGPAIYVVTFEYWYFK